MKNRTFLLIITGLLLAYPMKKVNALDYVKKENVVCTETEAHKNWYKLSNSEKSKTLEPVMCEEDIKLNGGLTRNKELGAINNVDYKNLTKFDLRDVAGKSYVSPQKNQDDTRLCWIFATTSAIESANLVEGNNPIELSQKHIAFNTTYRLSDGNNPLGIYANTSWNVGGNPYTSGEYLSSGRGPVSESKVPWSSTVATLSLANTKADYYVDNSIILENYGASQNKACDADTILNIKYLITTYGAVFATMYAGDSSDNDYVNSYLSNNKTAYFYKGVSIANHAITIVGWDDNYSKDNFSESKSGTPKGDGAWIVKNTYSSIFGGEGTEMEAGYHYISYYDDVVCTQIMSVNGVNNKVSDNSYYYDALGRNGRYESPTNTVIFKEVFDKKSSNSEALTKVSLFLELLKSTTGKVNNDKYEILYSEIDDINKAKLIASGTVTSTGYITKKISTPIAITNNKFYIYYKYISSPPQGEGKTYYIPLEKFTTDESKALSTVAYRPNIVSGKAFYSLDKGTTWNDTVSNAEISFYPILHVFTENINYNITASKPESISNVTEDGGYFYIPLTLSNISSLDDINVKVLDKNNNDVTNNFTIKKYQEGYKIAVKSGTTNAGDYNVQFTYNLISIYQGITVNEKEKVLITKIDLTNNRSEVSVNGTLNLSATVIPTNATNKNVKWTSSDNNIATVNDNGVVTGKKAGSVTITATAIDSSNVKGTITVKVIDINKEEGNKETTPINNDSGSTIDSNSNSKVNNPKTGLNTTCSILIICILVSLIVYLKVNKKKIFVNFK